MHAFLARILALTLALLAAPAAALDRAPVYDALLFGDRAARAGAARTLAREGSVHDTPALILAMRYRGAGAGEAFRRLSGSNAGTWFEAMLWQERRKDLTPDPAFESIKRRVLTGIDPAFERFLGNGRALAMDIRLEEIAWGGVRVDGIPSLDDPALIAAGQATYLNDDDLVFGVSINGDARAYPLRIMGWHEMFNDVIGGVPVALAYCTLCGAGILYETAVPGFDAPLRFGSSGLLYRSNKLMFDRATDSLWNQFTGIPVSGPLRGRGIELKRRPVVTTTWAEWREDHPQTRVLSLNTGHSRDYGSGVVYRDYFASPALMFPALGGGAGLSQKDRVFGLAVAGGARAWPMEAFRAQPVINDRVGFTDVVLVGDADIRTVRAYDRRGMSFRPAGEDTLSGPGGLWRVTEDALEGPGGERLPRLPGHLAYWFAWESYHGGEATLYGRS